MELIMKAIYFFSVLFVLFMVSCTKDKAPAVQPLDPNCTDTISFSLQVKPLIEQNCSTSGCHDAATASDGYDFTTHANIAQNTSIMLSAMRSESGATPMPLGGPELPDSLIQQFSCWAGQGKLNN